MLDLSFVYLVVGILLGFLIARTDVQTRHGASLDAVTRRVWPRLRDWRDREIADALAHPDHAREQHVTHLWRRRFGLQPHEDTPVEVQRAIRDVLECPWPERED